MWHYGADGADTHKTCTHCKQIKPLEDFPVDNDKRSGKKSHCRLCHASLNQQRRDENPYWHPAIQQNYRAKQYGKDGRVSPTEISALFEAAGHKCPCGATTDLEIDHIVPLNKGGEHEISNLQVLCKSCNSAKGDRWPNDV